MKENAKRSAESILMLYIHFPLSFLDTSGARLNKLLQYNKYQFTKRWLEEDIRLDHWHISYFFKIAQQ